MWGGQVDQLVGLEGESVERSRCSEGEEELGAGEARDRCPGRGIRSGVENWGPTSGFRARMAGWEGPLASPNPAHP